MGGGDYLEPPKRYSGAEDVEVMFMVDKEARSEKRRGTGSIDI